MKPSTSPILARLAAFALVFTCAAIAASPQARGSGPTMAVTEFTNDAGAPQSTVDALGQAAYAAIGASGKFTAVGDGPLKVKSSYGGDLIVSALDAARKVNATEIITTDLLSASGGTVTYRMSAYRVDPLAFIRSGIFTQSSLAPASLTAGFATNLATLHAPRTALGSIYSLDQGIKADMGEASGAALGDVYNVVRDGQKLAQAKIVSIDLTSATIEITNPTAGYKPRIGDQLVGIGPLPAVPPSAHTNANTFSILALLAATGAALWAIGHHGEPAQPGPAPSITATPTGGFSVVPAGQSGTPPSETFQFTFSQPVNTGGITFTTPTYVSFQKTNGGTVIIPANTPVTILGGPTPTFGAGNTTLTINATTLNPGDVVIFSFTSSITSTTSVALTPTNITFTAAVAHHPLSGVHGQNPVPPHGGVLVPVGAGAGPKPLPPGHDPNNPK